MHLEGKADSGNRTAATCRTSENLRREGGRGPCLGAFGVCGLGNQIPFPSPLLQRIISKDEYMGEKNIEALKVEIGHRTENKDTTLSLR